MTTPAREILNKVSNSVLEMGGAAAIGYFCARIFTKINPVHGAVFCAVASLISKVVDPVFDAIFSGPGANAASKIIGEVLSISVGIAASAAISTGLGFAISFNAGFILSLSILATATIFVVGGLVAAASCR